MEENELKIPDAKVPTRNIAPSLEALKAARRVLAKAEGVGDVVKAATVAMGIEPCEGCEERRKILNQYLPFAFNRQVIDG